MAGMKFKKPIAFLLILSLLFLSGCWDKIEIEQRAIIVAVVVDSAKKESSEEESEAAANRKDKITVTFGMIKPSEIQGKGKAFISETVTGSTFADAIDRLSNRISRRPFFGQMRLLLFTGELIKDSEIFREVLDDFDRRAVINQNMKVGIIKGDSKKIHEVEPKLENLNAAYIVGVMQNEKISSDIISMTFADMLKAVRDNEGSIMMPFIKIDKRDGEDFVIHEATLIKDYRFLTNVDTKYIGPYKMISKKFERGNVYIDYKGINVPYTIYNMKIRFFLEDEKNLKYKVNIETEGDIVEYLFGEEVFETKTISEVEESISKEIKKNLKETTLYFQQEIGHDYLGFGEYTNKYHNKVYKKYKDNWDEAFNKLDITYKVDAKIRRVGTVRK